MNILPAPFSLPHPEEYLLDFPFFSEESVVRVKEHDRFLSCLAFGERRFPQGVFFMDMLFIRCYLFSFSRRVVVVTVKNREKIGDILCLSGREDTEVNKTQQISDRLEEQTQMRRMTSVKGQSMSASLWKTERMLCRLEHKKEARTLCSVVGCISCV